MSVIIYKYLIENKHPDNKETNEETRKKAVELAERIYNLRLVFVNNLESHMGTAIKHYTREDPTESQRIFLYNLGISAISQVNVAYSNEKQEANVVDFVRRFLKSGGAHNYNEDIIDACKEKIVEFLSSAPQIEQVEIARFATSPIKSGNVLNNNNNGNPLGAVSTNLFTNTSTMPVIIFTEEDPAHLRLPELTINDIRNIKIATKGLEFLLTVDYKENVEPIVQPSLYRRIASLFGRGGRYKKTRKPKNHKRYSRKK